MKLRKKVVLGLALSVATAGIGVPAFAASGFFLDCTVVANTPVGNGYGGGVGFSGSMSCNKVASRYLRVDLMHNYDFLPDALVTGRTDNGTKSSYKASAVVCDNGIASTTYYTRSRYETAYEVDSGNAVINNHC